MKTFSRAAFSGFVASLALALPACAGTPTGAYRGLPALDAGSVVIAPDPDRPRPPFNFSDEDGALLDEVQRAAFDYFWNELSPGGEMVRDRSSADTVSVAGVGFQLAAMVIAAERGWVERGAAAGRSARILRALLDEPTNQKAGLYYHFLDGDATPKRIGTELVVSTIDSAILFAGAIVAGEYFGGEVRSASDEMLRRADWSFFTDPDAEEIARGFISLGWRPADDNDPTGAGALLPYYWIDSGDEHRLVTFLAVCAPEPAHRLEPTRYYALRRQLGLHEPEGPLVWFPYSGALFTAFFAHCWIDAARLGVDDPAAWGQEHRARVDWWENSRRIVRLHRDRAIANPLGLPTLGPDAWGLTACDGPEGYLVPGLFPEAVQMTGARAGWDFSAYRAVERWGGGVVPPYGAASSIVFEPGLALHAMRHMRTLRTLGGESVAWRGREAGGYGFVDAFRFDGESAWSAEDTVAIDHGPMLVLIENARTGLIWNLFGKNPEIRAGLERLGLSGAGVP
jgi:hypothetical protein